MDIFSSGFLYRRQFGGKVYDNKAIQIKFKENVYNDVKFIVGVFFMFKKCTFIRREFFTRFNPVNFMSIKLKLIITYTFLILLIVLTLQRISYNYASKIITNNSLKYSQLIVDKINTEIDKTFDELDRLTQTALSDQALLNSLSISGISNKSDSNEYQYTKVFLKRMLNFRRDIDKIILSNKDGELFVMGADSYVPPNYDMKNDEWYKSFSRSDDVFLVIPPHLNEINYGYEVFSVVRKIRTYSDNNVLGLIKIDRRANILDEICKKRELEDNSIIIFDKNKTPVYNTGINIKQDEISEIAASLNHSSGTIIIHPSRDTKVINYVRSDYTGLFVAFIVPEKILLKDLKVINTASAILTAICSILAFAFSIIISFAITRSVKKLLKGMKNIEAGELDTKVVIKSHDEIAVLAKGFNNMTEKIKILIKQNADMEVKKKEAEMMVLQGQINPHFLYNTLDGIRMKAVINKDDETAYMIEELSGLLRTSAHINKEFIPLEDELNYIRRYINLQNIRYKYKFELTIEIPDNLLKMIVPKFILQPVVENSIYHGLEIKKNDRKIVIKGIVENERVIISVEDNGVGMNEEDMNKLRQSLELSDDDPRAKIGLRNINGRLKLYYGQKFGIKINSIYQEGTTICLIFPAQGETTK